LQERNSIHLRHYHINQDDIWLHLTLLQGAQRLFGVGVGDNFRPLTLKLGAVHIKEKLIIINKHNTLKG
jgi:hypothetical protein